MYGFEGEVKEKWVNFPFFLLPLLSFYFPCFDNFTSMFIMYIYSFFLRYTAKMADLFTEVYNLLPLCHLINKKVLVCSVVSYIVSFLFYLSFLVPHIYFLHGYGCSKLKLFYFYLIFVMSAFLTLNKWDKCIFFITSLLFFLSFRQCMVAYSVTTMLPSKTYERLTGTGNHQTLVKYQFSLVS